MARVHAGAAAPTISYEDFEPFCHWEKDEKQQTLVLHLPEFRKDQLEVYVSNEGHLRIKGERPVDETKKSRFCKEIHIPNDCQSKQTQAKFSRGRLYIMMPKKIAGAQTTDQDHPTPDQKTGPAYGEDQAVSGSPKVAVNANVAVMVVAAVIALGALTTYMYKC
ncbi:hypothetical protein NMG60_11001598 [Bertholletia excelsa]